MLNFFGTDGIRGRVGSGLFVQDQLVRLGHAIAQWAQKKYAAVPHIIIGQDTRISSDFVKAALKTGLLQHAIKISDASVIPTPALAHIMKLQPDIDCALIISASHNPYHDNGIKIMDAKTGKLTVFDECAISAMVSGYKEAARGECSELARNVSNHAAEQNEHSFGTDVPLTDIEDQYCTRISSLFTASFLAGKRIVLDTAHGATYRVAPRIFEKLGAEVITINNQPTGYNINEQCGALHTEHLTKTIIERNADIGFAFDGDGDRVMAVNKHGMIKDGDDILALLLAHPRYSTREQVVGTIMTNEGFAQHLKQLDKQLVRTPVGDKYIAEKLGEHSWLLGGEPSGHIIMHDVINTGDGILVALRIAETLCLTGNWEMETFEHYPQAMINVPVASRKDLTTSPLSTIINAAQEDLATGRILVRYSGTENVLRVMVEANSYEYAHRTCKQLAHELSKAL